MSNKNIETEAKPPPCRRQTKTLQPNRDGGFRLAVCSINRVRLRSEMRPGLPENQTDKMESLNRTGLPCCPKRFFIDTNPLKDLLAVRKFCNSERTICDKRKKMRRYLIIILLTAIAVLSANEYTLEQFIEAGLNNSYSIRQKEIMLKNADLSVRSATWNLLPSADLAFSRMNRDEIYSNSGSLSFARTLTLNEPTLFNYRQSRLDKSIAGLDWQQTRKELVYDIFSGWLDISQVQKEIAIRTANLTILRRILEQSELQMRLGQRTQYEVNQSEINAINAELAIAELNNQLIRLRANLFNKVKLKDDGSPFAVTDTTLSTLQLDTDYVDSEPLLLSQLKESVRKSKLDKLQQKIGLLPSLYVSGRYEQYSVNNDVLSFQDYEDSYTLSLGVSWSLWTPWTKGSTYGQIRNSLILKQWQLEENEAALDLERENMLREWTYLTETLALNRKKSTQANDNLLIAREKYNLGTLSLIELEQARVNALDAELAVNKITYQLQKKAQEWNLLNSMPILNRY